MFGFRKKIKKLLKLSNKRLHGKINKNTKVSIYINAIEFLSCMKGKPKKRILDIRRVKINKPVDLRNSPYDCMQDYADKKAVELLKHI